MNLFLHLIMKTLFRNLTLALAFTARLSAAEPTAAELAEKLAALQQDGNSYVRLRLDVQRPGEAKVALQIQIKQRRTANATEVVYQVLWPKERKGEAVLLRRAGNQPLTGAIFTPPNTSRALDAAQGKEALFGSDLSYADVVENFYAWEKQAIVGAETVDRVPCQILESKPGKGQQSSYASVRSWVDTRRFVPLRVEKYSASGQVVRRIDTMSVATDDRKRHIPATLSIRGQKDSVTELDGSRMRHGVIYEDSEFTAGGLGEMKVPRTAAE